MTQSSNQTQTSCRCAFGSGAWELFKVHAVKLLDIILSYKNIHNRLLLQLGFPEQDLCTTQTIKVPRPSTTRTHCRWIRNFYCRLLDMKKSTPGLFNAFMIETVKLLVFLVIKLIGFLEELFFYKTVIGEKKKICKNSNFPCDLGVHTFTNLINIGIDLCISQWVFSKANENYKKKMFS